MRNKIKNNPYFNQAPLEMVLKSLISEPSEHVLDFIFGYFDDKFHIGSHLIYFDNFFLFVVYLPALSNEN